MHGTGHPEAAQAGALRLAMERHRLDDGHRQAPQAQQVGAGFGVARAVVVFGHRRIALVAHARQQQADVGQQRRRGAEFGTGARQDLRGQARGQQRAVLQGGAVHAGGGLHREDFAGQHQVAQRAQAQPRDGRAQIGDRAPVGEVGRVAQLQHLGGDGRIARHQLGDVVGGAFILFQRAGQREVQVRRRRQVFDPADGAAQARAVQQVAQFFQAVDRLQHGFRRQRQRQEAVRHADQLDRGGQAVVTAFQQRDADGFGTQRADLPQQRGRRQVGQRGPHHHHVDRAVGHREHRRLAVGHRFHGPLVSHVADVIGQIVRQAGGIANVQNAQSTSPCFVQPSTRALLAGHGPDEI